MYKRKRQFCRTASAIYILTLDLLFILMFYTLLFFSLFSFPFLKFFHTVLAVKEFLYFRKQAPCQSFDFVPWDSCSIVLPLNNYQPPFDLFFCVDYQINHFASSFLTWSFPNYLIYFDFSFCLFCVLQSVLAVVLFQVGLHPKIFQEPPQPR